MRITEEMRLQRALGHIQREKQLEEKSMDYLKGIMITDVIIIRNKKQMYMAEVDQAIRKIKERLKEIEEEKAS